MAINLNSSQLFLLLCLALVLSLFLLILSPFLTPILLATVAAALFYPLYRSLDKRLGGRPGLSSFCLCVFVTFLIILPIFFLVFTLASEIQNAFVQYQQSVEEGSFYIEGSDRLLAIWNRVSSALGLPPVDLKSGIQTVIHEVGLFLVRNSSAILAGFAGVVADFFIMIFTLFFLFRDGKSLLNTVLELAPLDNAHKSRLVDRFKETIYATFFGSFATAAAQGAATWLILWILNFQNSFLWGTLAAFTSLVPMVGAGLVWVPASVYLLLRGWWGQALVLVAYGTLVISMLDNILRPLVIQRTAPGSHTLLIFFGILGGISVFGFPGLILGPVVVAFVVTILDMVKLDFREPGE